MEGFVQSYKSHGNWAVECILGLDVGAEAVKNSELSCEAEAVKGFLAMNGVEKISQVVTALFDRQLGLWALAFPVSKIPGTLCFMRTPKCVEGNGHLECNVKSYFICLYIKLG